MGSKFPKYVNRYQLQFEKGVWTTRFEVNSAGKRVRKSRWVPATSSSKRNFYFSSQHDHPIDELGKYLNDNPGKWTAVKWWDSNDVLGANGVSKGYEKGWQYDAKAITVKSNEGAEEYYDFYNYDNDNEYGDYGEQYDDEYLDQLYDEYLYNMYLRRMQRNMRMQRQRTNGFNY